MSRLEAFTATVGVLLIENHPGRPWRSPVPPALAGARGWYLPTAAGPHLLFVVPADAWSAEDLDEARQQWRAWLSALRAAGSVLLLAYDEVPPPPPEAQEEIWPVWMVDLGAQRVERPEPPEETPFLAIADALLARYFHGVQYELPDLLEQEQARLEGKQPYGVFLRRQKTPASWVILGLIAGMYALSELLGGSTDPGVLLRMGANFRPLVQSGEVWRLVTASFLHIGLLHLAVNGYSLFVVGPMLEKLYGSLKFTAIYVFAGLTGALASYFFNPGSISAGASGALFGLLGAMLIIGLRHYDAVPDHEKRQLRTIALVTLLVNLALGFKIPGIDNFCHLGGLAGGTLLAAALGPDAALGGRRMRRPGLAGLLVLPLVAMLGLGVGVAEALVNHQPTMRLSAPSGDYALRLPLFEHGTPLKVARTGNELMVSADEFEHYVALAEAPNHGGLEATTEPDTLRAIAATFDLDANGAHVERHGKRNFLALAESGRERAFVLTTPARLYLIRTHGYADASWMGHLLDQVLTSFTTTP
ncbi:MAG TPA: rhomboid family intramembrane serine protease [Oscillatoriaceae cyanobacterium]